MSQIRIDVREDVGRGTSGPFGAGVAVPDRAAVQGRSRDATRTASRSWWARGLRVVRNAAIAVAVMALVPVGLVVTQRDWVKRMIVRGPLDTGARVATFERVRPFRVPTDLSITPLQAGIALNALQPIGAKSPGFEIIEPATRPIVAWRAVTLDADMFPTARPDFFAAPSARAILEASANGFTPRELEYLRALAISPVWNEFDLVARAPAVDVVGGQLRIPFGPEASPERRPLPYFKGSRELAYAAVSRAAYYMAIGQPETAESVLRSIVSYGFVFIDNGTSELEQLIGAMIVGVGRDALQRFYVIRHDPRATLPALAPLSREQARSMARSTSPLSLPEARSRLLARIEDPSAPFAERVAGLQSLQALSCTNVRELLLGPGADVRRVQELAAHSIARYPSERALVELQSRWLALPSGAPSANPFQTLAVSSATVAGAVLQNPRLASCTRLLTGPW